eukprot:TRINITY_DN598_c0_g1_i1.p1 TRINITY_DN598_c0_g1~~TRINITY_DN598_c0_g1_i1.p1  ORF type:complete len:625 (-),score=147.21 TRINITY_DN598_c0_g1_i1:108-1859(-)
MSDSPTAAADVVMTDPAVPSVAGPTSSESALTGDSTKQSDGSTTSAEKRKHRPVRSNSVKRMKTSITDSAIARYAQQTEPSPSSSTASRKTSPSRKRSASQGKRSSPILTSSSSSTSSSTTPLDPSPSSSVKKRTNRSRSLKFSGGGTSSSYLPSHNTTLPDLSPSRSVKTETNVKKTTATTASSSSCSRAAPPPPPLSPAAIAAAAAAKAAAVAAAAAAAALWTPLDDALLVDNIQAFNYKKIARTVNFSRRFPPADVEARWRSMLYDATVSEAAASRVLKCQAPAKRVLWGEEEERILRQYVPSEKTGFKRVLERNRSTFHSSRTVKSLEAHYYRMKRGGLLDHATTTATTTSTTTQHQDQHIENENVTHSSFLKPFADVETSSNLQAKGVVHEDDGSKEEAYRRLQDDHSVALDREETNFSRERGDLPSNALAVLYGRRLFVPMVAQRILLGRTVPSHHVDVDLSSELESEAAKAKVSRSQAIIEVLHDGAFLIRNIGRHHLFVNGRPVRPNHSRVLGDTCLIEVGEARLVFEINRQFFAKVEEYLVASSQLQDLGSSSSSSSSSSFNNTEKVDVDLDVG